MIDQTVWLAPRATSYTVVCGECSAQHGYVDAQVQGRLALEREHSAVSCRRGHEISIMRGRREAVRLRLG